MLRSSDRERFDGAKQAKQWIHISSSPIKKECRRFQSSTAVMMILIVLQQCYIIIMSSSSSCTTEVLPSPQELIVRDAPAADRPRPIVSNMPPVRHLSNSSIPRILHFIHITEKLLVDNEIPPDVARNVAAWQEMHPKWKVMTWTNADVRREFGELTLMELLLEIPGPRSWISNILRYKIVLEYGGIYLDTDIVPIHPLDPLLVLQNFTVCELPYRHEEPVPSGDLSNITLSWDDCEKACNAVIGSTKDNEALQGALMRSRVNTRFALDKALKDNMGNAPYSLKMSGPVVWSRLAKQKEVNVLHEKTFYPCHFDFMSECKGAASYAGDKNTFAMHMWAKSWKAWSKGKQPDREETT